MTLEQQLDALIAQHGLTSITISRMSNRHGQFWGINAQGDGLIGTDVDDQGRRSASATDGLTRAIADLNAQRTPPVIVPELERLA